MKLKIRAKAHAVNHQPQTTMNEELQNELEAINSIYGDGSLILADADGIYILSMPHHSTSLRIEFPSDYPASPPSVLGTESSGSNTRKGEASHVVDTFRAVLGLLFQPGEVCLFDVIEEVNAVPSDARDAQESAKELPTELPIISTPTQSPEPPWTLSDVITELKSIFIARCAPVSSPDQAKSYLQHLLDSDKKIRSATHNITAWRIKGDGGVTFQDCDDNGETAAGGRVLHLMQLMDIWDVMVVVTRWYGGHQLGPKRFSIINAAARDAFVKGGFVGDAKKKGRK